MTCPGKNPAREETIKILVSACLSGEKVRYDGRAKENAFISRLKNTFYTIVPVCPEMEAGMGCPRPPLHLVHNGSAIHCLQTENHSIDVTQALTRISNDLLSLHSDSTACILKSRSPSCGLGNTKLFSMQNKLLHSDASGVFAAILSNIDSLICVNETSLQTYEQRVSFLLHAHFNKMKKNPDIIYKILKKNDISVIFLPDNIFSVLDLFIEITLSLNLSDSDRLKINEISQNYQKKGVSGQLLRTMEKISSDYPYEGNLLYWLQPFIHAR